MESKNGGRIKYEKMYQGLFKNCNSQQIMKKDLSKLHAIKYIGSYEVKERFQVGLFQYLITCI